MKRLNKGFLGIVCAMVMTMVVLTACTAVQISAFITFHADGTGSRKITASIAKNDHQDGYGSAYYYLSKHGDELKQYLVDAYGTAVAGSEEWLTISVDDSGAEWEVVDLTFEFSSFDDYKDKLAKLAFNSEEVAPAPEFITNDDGTVTYTENEAVLKGIFKSIQTTIMADDSIFDINSTKDGVALNDGSSDFDSLASSGVELMKPDFGSAMTIQFGQSEGIAVESVEGVYTVTASYDGGVAPEKEHVMSNVLTYTFDGNLGNTGTAAESDLTYGVGSTEGGPVFVDGIDGQAIQLDGKTYLASPNKTYSYDEMTVSFYYKMNAYTETDTGANMILVPAGLGALGGGVIDIEFIREGDMEGIQLLIKMNSADWQTQDKLYSDGYFLETRLDEWHNYTIVYKNEYDDFGNIEDAFVYLYIDGQVAARSRLSVAAGLSYSLGAYDDGSFGEPNGGFNVGGYYEAETVKRGSTGLLDNLIVYDGALSEEQVKELCYTIAVEKPYDPLAEEEEVEEETKEPQPTQAPVEETKEEAKKESNNTALIVVIVVAVVAVAGGVVVYIKKKK